jgi:hypothetical protein
MVYWRGFVGGWLSARAWAQSAGVIERRATAQASARPAGRQTTIATIAWRCKLSRASAPSCGANAPQVSKGHIMGKYKLWLHHQEIGHRLRDQINTLDQERARVQQMAPDHPAPLPETNNPIITALLSYTEAGHKLSNIDVIKAAMPKLDGGPDQPQPAPSHATSSAAASAAPAANPAVVASLLARAQQLPSDPLEEMQQLSRSQEAQFAPSEVSAAGASPQGSSADSVQSWWQNRQRDDQD